MINFQRNNLDKASSPYLQQHKDNPIHWQEWSPEVLVYDKKNNKVIFVSVGYATCHWCHVMAYDTFEDQAVAEFLNKHFVSIKVDREQRPDIDQFMMSFITQTTGSGGWPLNVILTPDLKPFFAVTYVSAKPHHGMPAFLDILKQTKDFYHKHKGKIREYRMPVQKAKDVSDAFVVKGIQSEFDAHYGGFGQAQKFPPHNTLLFLLHKFEHEKNKTIKDIVEKTLDSMALRGLHDHLQGGFFRYCVDREWTIPHFEKMLYDQAMLLWVYSVAYKVFGKEEYKRVAEKIISCLQETFEEKGLFYSGHDADTDHEEGKTYTWTYDELQKTLTKEEFSQFTAVFDINKKGNFEGKNHLIKKKMTFLEKIEKKLLQARRKRKQPFVDNKFVTGWNALTGIGLLMAYRHIGNTKALEKAKQLFKKVIDKHYVAGKVYHSSIGNKLQKQEFLEDYASLLLFATYLYEETGRHKDMITQLRDKLKGFYKDVWYETMKNDFIVPAQLFDHPTPSSVSLAEYALLRTKILLAEEFMPLKYKAPLQYDFFNLYVFVSNGNFHIIDSPEKIRWDTLPLNCIQRRSKTITDCFSRSCTEFKNVQELVTSLKNK